MNQIIPKANLKLTSGGEPSKYTYYGDSGISAQTLQASLQSLTSITGKGVHCYFCPKCTSHIYHHQEVMGDDTIVARTILLEGGKQLPVSAEIFGKDKLGWEKEVATTFKTLPE